jgi:tetratricopeptide (TPR) repeat protein
MQRTRFYRFITIATLLFLLASCASKAVTEPVLTKTSTITDEETIRQAEALFKQRDDAAKMREAVKLLGAARSADNRNFEIEWQFAKFNYFLGRQTSDDKEAEKCFEDGVQAGKIASRIEPNKPDGHFWYAANLGEQASRSPLTVGIRAIDEIRSEMNKVIEIQPDYQAAAAYDALAQVELKAGMLGGGKPEKAVEYLEKALTISKENTYLYLHLAEAYLAINRKADAKRQLDFVLKMKPSPDYMPEYRECVDKAKDLLEKRF